LPRLLLPPSFHPPILLFSCPPSPPALLSIPLLSYTHLTLPCPPLSLSSHPTHAGPPSQQMDMACSLSDSGRLELVHSQVWISASPLPYSLLTSCLSMSSCPTLVLLNPHACPSCSSCPSLLTHVLACSFSHPPSLPLPHACPSCSSHSFIPTFSPITNATHDLCAHLCHPIAASTPSSRTTDGVTEMDTGMGGADVDMGCCWFKCGAGD
jgi:hypothetical protein